MSCVGIYLRPWNIAYKYDGNKDRKKKTREVNQSKRRLICTGLV